MHERTIYGLGPSGEMRSASTLPLLCWTFAGGEFVMPGVDFESVRSAVSITRVLDLLGFVVQSRAGNQVRGACPLHISPSPRSRSFSANLETNQFRCFKCGKAGGQLELWAAFRGITVYEAAIELCDRLAIEVPWVRRWYNESTLFGYLVEAVQAGFPDCEAKRQIDQGKWQRVRIECEFESRNFRDHGHPPDGCDLIVCWRHNWPECPPNLEVVELGSVLGMLSSADD